MNPRLDGRVAVVTRAANGTGRTLARRLAAEGAAVAALDIADATATVAATQAIGANAAAITGDITHPEQVSRAAGDVQARLGPVGIPVNNAGIYGIHRNGQGLLIKMQLDDRLARHAPLSTNATDPAGFMSESLRTGEAAGLLPGFLPGRAGSGGDNVRADSAERGSR